MDDTGTSGSIYFEAGVILLLILINGFFSLAEMSLVASRKVRLRQDAERGVKGAATALRLLREPDRLFSTVQIGITLVGILTGAYGGAALAEHLSAVLARVDVLRPYSGPLGFGLVILLITYFTLILGELVPKRMAFGNPEACARRTAPVMALLLRLALPLVHLLSASSRAASRLLRLPEGGDRAVTEEDIRGLIGEGAASGVVEHAERDMLERIFRLGDRRAGSLMTHRSQVEWLDLDMPDAENMQRIAQSSHSCFPVARGDIAAATGVLKARDFLAARLVTPDIPVDGFIRQPLYIPETARALTLLDLFRHSEGLPFALVVDEYGEVQGVVTPNDVLEAVVGELPDEGGDPDPAAVRREDGSWLLDGLLPFDEMCSLAGLGAAEDPDDRPGSYETLAGFMLHRLGRMPAMGDALRWRGHRFEIVDMDGRRIDRVLVSPDPERADDVGDDAP
uniref:HlyC/CorC family transporter n=1 Tax=Nitratidesulfovibrio vulgaris (strain DSM 19637 / Miyazaki F) TaxID=883 RepID=B8DL84_NITV9